MATMFLFCLLTIGITSRTQRIIIVDAISLPSFHTMCITSAPICPCTPVTRNVCLCLGRLVIFIIGKDLTMEQMERKVCRCSLLFCLLMCIGIWNFRACWSFVATINHVTPRIVKSKKIDSMRQNWDWNHLWKMLFVSEAWYTLRWRFNDPFSDISERC